MVYVDQPHVSVVLTTRDRPNFLAIALRAYLEQIYPHRDLIVVDDGTAYPVDEPTVQALGGQLVRVPSGTTIGAKLNAGIALARGPLIQKMDDDDWYAPHFLASMVEARASDQVDFCGPTLTFAMPFLFFELGPWEIRQSRPTNVPGATLMFERDDWREQPFRDLATDEDVWFFRDHRRKQFGLTPMRNVDDYLAVRHHGVRGNRGHTWLYQSGHQTLEEYLQSRPLHEKQPADLLPDWALHAYRAIRAGMMLREHAEPQEAGL